jgi:hypothetical protein
MEMYPPKKNTLLHRKTGVVLIPQNTLNLCFVLGFLQFTGVLQAERRTILGRHGSQVRLSLSLSLIFFERFYLYGLFMDSMFLEPSRSENETLNIGRSTT